MSSRIALNLPENFYLEEWHRVVQPNGVHSREDYFAAVESCYKLIRLTIDEARAEEFRTAAKDIIARGG